MTIQLRVGGKTIGFDEAKAWAKTYLVDRPGVSAYPAYDGYPGSAGESVDRQDLLAVALLNVSNNPLPVYYGLEKLMEPLNERLEDPALTGHLASAGPETLEAIVELFGVLEQRPTKYVRLTTLSKVLHRKRPGLLPLFDDNIGYCYSECAGAPVPYVSGRSAADYRRAWLTALRDDLASRLEQWEEIAAIASGPAITPLRALDIIGWELGNRRNQPPLFSDGVTSNFEPAASRS
ncbi:DUF6308 family protein [Arthrobacter mobilis]|uniref:Uncharacterized protein n=1 Tax=Arthrobacter mobilis TaxID=2724944 RepID=A0A7X6K7U6_9MICC|nr:DUF6308 family protein [Arthrobacter mobilis]NKX56757.1 hypothetical protein [Arthrobacter mobilis]